MLKIPRCPLVGDIDVVTSMANIVGGNDEIGFHLV